MVIGRAVLLNSHVMTAGGFDEILQENLATPPSWTSVETGWTSNAEIAVTKLDKFRISTQRHIQKKHYAAHFIGSELLLGSM